MNGNKERQDSENEIRIARVFYVSVRGFNVLSVEKGKMLHGVQTYLVSELESGQAHLVVSLVGTHIGDEREPGGSMEAVPEELGQLAANERKLNRIARDGTMCLPCCRRSGCVAFRSSP